MKINNQYWRVGTSVNKYFNNYLQDINHLDKFEEFSIIDDRYLLFSDMSKLDYKSRTTLRQNLVAWQAFGFIDVKNKHLNSYIKLLEPESEKYLFEYSRYQLLIPSKKENVSRYRGTVIINMLANLNNEKYIKENVYSIRSKNVNFETILKSVSDYEKFLLEDEFYKQIIKKIGESNV